MEYIEMLPDNSFVVSKQRVNNSIFREILKNGSVSQIEKATRERVFVGAKNTEQQVQLDSEQKQGIFDNLVDATVSVAPRELT